MTLSGTQAAITAQMLDMAANKYSNHGSNDFELENTPNNLEFVRGMIASSEFPDDEPNISKDGKKIYTMDWMVMLYCKKLVLQAAA